MTRIFTMKKILIFSYGTLSNPKYIELLIERVPYFTPATLSGYGCFLHPQNGYLFVKPEPNGEVSGTLLTVSQAELELIDLWEDVPFYSREKLIVKTEQGLVEAFVYTQNNSEGIPLEKAKLKDDAATTKDIRQFLRWLKTNREK